MITDGDKKYLAILDGIVKMKTEDLRVRHFIPLKNPAYDFSKPTLRMYGEFLAEFSGVPANFIITRVDPKSILHICEHITKIHEGATRLSRPPKSIQMAGKEWRLIDPNKEAAAWHIDWDSCDINEDPVRTAAMFYYPAGEIYGLDDENGNIINPLRDRWDTFDKHFPLKTFLDCCAFFLSKYERSMRLSTERNKASQRATNLIQKLKSLFSRGRKQST